MACTRASARGFRPGQAGVHRRRRVARHRADGRPAEAHGAHGGHQLGRPRRAHRALPAARRQAMNFVGALERADWRDRVVERARHQRGARRRLRRMARRHPGADPQHRGAVQVGADGARADASAGRWAGSRCSGTPATRCCRSSPRAPTWRSRTATCSRRALTESYADVPDQIARVMSAQGANARGARSKARRPTCSASTTGCSPIRRRRASIVDREWAGSAGRRALRVAVSV